MKRPCKSCSILRNLVLHQLSDGMGGIHGNTVPGMNSRPLDMLHDTGNQDVGAVAHRVYLHLLALQVLVHQNGMILCDAVDDGHELLDLLIGDGNLHSLTSQHVGGTHQHGIAQTVCHGLGLLGSVHRTPRRSGNPRLLQNLVEQLPVLRRVHVLRLGAQNRNTHAHQALRKLDGCLSAELHHRPLRLLDIHNGLHILRSQRLKVQLVRNIEIRAHRLRIVVDDDGLIACSGKRPCGMDGAVIELDSLPDADRPGAQHQHLPAALFLPVPTPAKSPPRSFLREASGLPAPP